MNKRRLTRALLFAVFALTSALSAAQHSHGGTQMPRGDSGGMESHEARPPEQPQLFRGEVRFIDKAAAQLTLKHEAIRALEVPARTMAYPVKDAGMLDQLKIGDAVRFSMVLQGRELLITSVVPVP